MPQIERNLENGHQEINSVIGEIKKMELIHLEHQLDQMKFNPSETIRSIFEDAERYVSIIRGPIYLEGERVSKFQLGKVILDKYTKINQKSELDLFEFTVRKIKDFSRKKRSNR